jgi:hypothetical protein
VVVGNEGRKRVVFNSAGTWVRSGVAAGAPWSVPVPYGPDWSSPEHGWVDVNAVSVLRRQRRKGGRIGVRE